MPARRGAGRLDVARATLRGRADGRDARVRVRRVTAVIVDADLLQPSAPAMPSAGR